MHTNLTTGWNHVIYPQMMYESLLRNALDEDESFEFKTTQVSYPHTAEFYQRKLAAHSPVIMLAFTVALLIQLRQSINYLVEDRITGRKTYLTINGLNLVSYWIGHFIYDFLKLLSLIVTTLVVLIGFGVNGSHYKIAFLMFPFTILPFTYVVSLCFSRPI